MQTGKSILALSLLYIGVSLINLNDAVEFKLTNAVCMSYNKSWVVMNTCRLKAISRNKTTFNFNCTILHPVNDFQLHGQIFKRANGYKPWLFNIRIDVCRFLIHPYNPLVSLVYRMAKEYSNFNHTCPYIGHQYVKDFYPRLELLRLPLPTGDYMLTTRWFYDRKLHLDANISFTFVEDLINQ
ncbi:uncharacterized protein LOC111519393 [Drosophila willistoni]|uniref:uncharacterized protein LOC111519393 n=1 Tax=Drosophila willistoni TaxID=7260 RepID=UPI000C26CC3F|nr:uncharacterized protein LOC111519393 [Drosophila willistoni]